MLCDFAELKAPINEMVDQYLDHYYLNESLRMESPTSEEIARWCWRFLYKRIPNHVALVRIVIEETCTCRCEYYGEH
jgi:6-pyruvoyltetrahydropterin/6-carboxytetrahydropterin synthase